MLVSCATIHFVYSIKFVNITKSILTDSMVVLSSFSPPTDGIKHEQPNTIALVNQKNLGQGTLYIAESILAWVGSDGGGFGVEYPKVAIHAVSRDLASFPQECLYLMLDSNEDVALDNPTNEEEEDEEITELRFVPQDKGMLDAMFQAMSVCQALHPDPDQQSFSDEDFFEDADDEETPMEEAVASLHIGPNGNQNGNNADDDMDAGCFEDADESPEN